MNGEFESKKDGEKIHFPTLPPSTSVFARRIGALLVDCAALASLGHGIGFVFHDRLVGIGWMGRAIGFALVLLYFGVMQSGIGRGQSLGKRLISIRVMGVGGGYLSLPVSMARAGVLALPFFLFGIEAPAALTVMPLFTLGVGGIVLGGGSAIVYLFLFNRKTRRSLHDFIAGSVVVRESVEDPDAAPPLWRGHVIVSAALIASAFFFLNWSMNRITVSDDVSRSFHVQRSILELENVYYASVRIGADGLKEGPSTYVAVKANVLDWPGDPAGFASGLAKMVLKRHPFAAEQDGLRIRVSRGFDIGIARFWQHYQVSKSPAEWMGDKG